MDEQLGSKYVEKRTIPFETSYEETGPSTPVFFVLSPGVDPLKDVEAVGKKLGFTLDDGNLHNVSLGQVGKVETAMLHSLYTEYTSQLTLCTKSNIHIPVDDIM